MSEENIIDKVKRELTDYLNEKGHRKTTERYTILEFIYNSEEDHFDIDTLYNSINKSKHIVSKATLYNTMELLVDSKLVARHRFGNNAHYERAYNVEDHHHLICTVCGCIKEVKDIAVKEVINAKKLPRFTLNHYSLYIYGVCSKCSRKPSKKENNPQ
ncbi:MAG: Fur family transcriptional regulator [Bacteroidales bacterium]